MIGSHHHGNQRHINIKTFQVSICLSLTFPWFHVLPYLYGLRRLWCNVLKTEVQKFLYKGSQEFYSWLIVKSYYLHDESLYDESPE